MFWLKWKHHQGDEIQVDDDCSTCAETHSLNPWTRRRLLLWSTKLQKYKLVKIYKTAKNVLTGVYRLLK